MKFIAEASEASPVNLVGGKGAHLQKLIQWEAPVAPFFVLTTDCFLHQQQTGQLPDAVRERFQVFFQEHKVVALRSSMTGEDHADASFAGLFETVLGVRAENWEESLMRIYSSVHSQRVKEYVEKKKLEVDLRMAVVVQEEIQVEKSGVLFTRSPVEPTSTVAIDAAYGMGEGVVSGHAMVDHYQYTRTLEPVKEVLQDSSPVLTTKEAQELINLSLKMEHHLGRPADIEWGMKNSRLYLFQIRPITRSFKPLTYFVDTNLSESYPGVVSPFTASFVKKAYQTVFQESAVIMGAKGEKLNSLALHYAKLISSVDNHLYYNLEHYYAVLRALPGGEKNIEDWHRMIGGKMSGVSIPYHKTAPTKLETLWTVIHLGNLILSRRPIFASFLKDLDRLRAGFEQKFSKLTTPQETTREIYRMATSTHGFGLTVINDIFVMMGLGLLTRIVRKKGLREEEVIDLLKTTEGVDSVKPLERFNHLVSQLPLAFIEDFGKCDLAPGFHPYEAIWKKLASKWEEEVQNTKKFLQDYGDRSFEELKLESLPLKNHPALFHHLLTWAKMNPPTSHQKMEEKQLPRLGWLGGKILSFTRESIAMREATRLWRGKFYHLLRELVLKLGEQLVASGTSWASFSVLDFFSIDHNEWKAFGEGKLSALDIQEKMTERRSWQTKKRHYPEIIPWVESEPLPDIQSAPFGKDLQGQGVSPGITEARALVLENPTDALSSDLSDFILVTRNTDPAWVYIMSRSRGLISEKGSLLSHTAIIGRELNIPTIVGVKLATQKIKNGDRLRMDATTGAIDIL